MKSFARTLTAIAAAGSATALAIAAVVIGGYFYVEPGLPQADDLRDVRLQIPLRVYTRDGRLIQQFGSQKRTPVAYEQLPQVLVEALIAAEDDRFFEHPGLDFLVTVRSIFRYVAAGGERVAGGSTITQQVAREYFLSRDFSLVRKFKEWILALRIEREFTKEEILELFFNVTFFGQSSYGVAAAAQTYFGKDLAELTISDAAILAGIPQGPSIMNPIYSPDNATARRAYVLRRMNELGFITEAEYQTALAEPVTGERHGLEMEVEAPYIAEMVRAEMVRRFGQAAYTAGLKVTTTVDSRLQAAATRALRAGVVAYDERHGYRGPLARLELPEDAPTSALPETIGEAELREALADHPPLVGLETAVVLRVGENDADVFFPSRGTVTIGLAAVEWAAPYIDDNNVAARPKTVSEVFRAGDIVRFRELDDGSLRLAQLPDAQSAFVALDPLDGAIVALNGGFDFYLDSYNRATQAKRQPGSAFKPFVYSAALENGFTTATIVNDAPLTINDPLLETTWKPENYTNRFYGQVRLREALTRSLNAATVRLLLDVRVPNAIRHLRNFGFDDVALPANASLALGAGGIAPVDLAAGYAVFANGGQRVTPYFIDRIEDAAGEALYQAKPAIACADCVGDDGVSGAGPARATTVQALSCSAGDLIQPDPDGPVGPRLIDDVTELYPPLRLAPRAITPQNAYLVADMLQDVIYAAGGTGAAARRALERGDLAGKTGTTNDSTDAWFAGFTADVVATAWVGFNQNRPLGRGEQGGVTAIPIWTDFMAVALEGVPERPLRRPPGIVDVRINPENGLVASGSNPNSVFEKFRVGHVPEREAEPSGSLSSFPSAEPPPSGPPPKIF